MNMSRWQNVRICRFSHMPLSGTEPFPGVGSLSVFDTVENPVRGAGGILIIDTGYHWIQLAPRDENFWITAMFTDELSLVQLYFDITRENVILPNGGSWCDDLYLDIVIDSDGTLTLLDEDELSCAFERGEINRALYTFAHDTARAVCDRFSKKEEFSALTALCREYLMTLIQM